MLKKTLALVSLGLFIVLGSHPAMAQFGQMRGTVINEDGTPFVGAEVHIDREDIRGHYELKTDKDGKFFHAGLPLGRYSVSVVMSNGQKFSIGNIQTRMQEPAQVDINLQQERMRAEAAAAGVQLEGELSQEQIEAIEKLSAERAEQIKKRQELTGRFDEAMAAMAAKDYDTAIPAFEAAAEADSTQHVVFAQLGEAFSGKATQASNSAENRKTLPTTTISPWLWPTAARSRRRRRSWKRLPNWTPQMAGAITSTWGLCSLTRGK